jgi:hypothetical protein
MRRFVSLAVGTLGCAVLLSSCAGSGYTYVQTKDGQAFFKVPVGWKGFSKEQILVASGQGLSPASDQAFSTLVGYDSDPRPSINHIIDLNTAPVYPVVEAQAITLPEQTRDQLSLAGLRNFIYPLDQLYQSGQAQVISHKDITLPGGFHGSQYEYALTPNGIVSANLGTHVIRANQITILDPATNKLYVFVVRCESHCYRDNGKLIQQIVDSWTVKER